MTLGPPPKVIWIRRGNCSAAEIARILRDALNEVRRFVDDTAEAFLILD